MLNNDERKLYWDGGANKVVRYYFYLNRGLSLLNEARYLIIAILALYAILKMDNPAFLVLMFSVSIPLLCILGWLQVHKMAKIMDFLNVRFSTHYSKYQVELQEEQNRLLSKIIENTGKPAMWVFESNKEK